MKGRSGEARYFGNGDDEAGAAGEFEVHADVAAVEAHDLAAEVEPDAAPAGLAGEAPVDLVELGENHLVQGGVDFFSPVGDAEEPLALG